LNEIPFKFVIINNENAKFKNLLMIKYDHILSDGLGIKDLICALADNFSLDLFPRATSKKKSFLDYLILFILIPYYFFNYFYGNLFLLSYEKSPFKLNNKINSGRSNIEITKNFNFNSASKICKSLNVTFNDLMMSIISSSYRKFCKEKNLEIPKNFSAAIPVGNRKLPENLNQIKIMNDSTAVGCNIDIINNPIYDCLKIHKNLKDIVRNIPFIMITKFFTDFNFKFFPSYLSKYIIRNAGRNLDFTISNVAGPKNALVYEGGKIIEILVFSSPGYFGSLILIYSYNGQFKFVIIFDEVVGIDIKLFKELIENEIIYVFNYGNIKHI